MCCLSLAGFDMAYGVGYFLGHSMNSIHRHHRIGHKVLTLFLLVLVQAHSYRFYYLFFYEHLYYLIKVFFTHHDHLTNIRLLMDNYVIVSVFWHFF